MSTTKPPTQDRAPDAPASPGSSALPAARVVEPSEAAEPGSRSHRAAHLGALAVVVVAGWGFILWANKFHVTPAAVIMCLGYLAVVATIFNLWRTGVAAVQRDNPALGAWDRPMGAFAELEREKRTLLKAIKEAEFDFAMGKLSSVDSEALIQVYRARAIEVIKEIDRQSAGMAMSPRAQIHLEVKARMALAERAPSAKGLKQPDKQAVAGAEPNEQPATQEPT